MHVLPIILTALSAYRPAPVISASGSKFLRDQAARLVASARLAPGQTAGRWTNGTPYVLRVPGGNMGYPAFWVRDAVMMLGADLIPAGEVEGWIRLMARSIQAPGDRQVRAGVTIPAYTVPDHIDLSGAASFFPGSYDTGEKQGGYPWGNYPPLDDNFYFIGAVYEQYRLTRSLKLFRSEVATGAGEMKLSSLCERVFNAVPADGRTGLVTAGDVRKANAKDWGFCDAEFKSGALLFPSLLRRIAATQLEALFAAAGSREEAERCSAAARQIRSAIPEAYFKRLPNGEGWLLSATGVGNQPDVWGSAFAVWSGAVSGTAADAIGRALRRSFLDRTAVRDGCVRQILITDALNHGGWQSSVVPVGTYQNGGYWGVPTGWVIAAIARVDRVAAARLAADYVDFLRSHMRPDGTSEAWEWFNPETGDRNNPLYVATVALPYISLKEAGLLH